MPGGTRQAYARGLQRDEEQDVVDGWPSPGKHFDGEESAPHIYRKAMCYALTEGGLLAKLRNRFIANNDTAIISVTADRGSHDHAGRKKP